MASKLFLEVLSQVPQSTKDLVRQKLDFLEWFDLFELDQYGQYSNIEEFETGGDKFVFDIQITIFGGYRLCLREKDSLTYITNWCLGKDVLELKRMVFWVKSIDITTLDKLPFCSNVKPLANDKDFLEKLKELGYE